MNIRGKIEDWVKKTLKTDDAISLVHPKDLKNGDYSFHSTAPWNDLVRKLLENKIPEIEKIEVAGSFVNFYLSKDFFAESVKEINKEKVAFAKASASRAKILIEHTQPNPFKEFHIGHLMNNAIGESVGRILAANGAEVTAVGYHGDVGLHVAKTIWGKMKNPESSWGEAYAYGAQNYENNKEEITNINIKISDRSDKEINKLYEEGRGESLENFEQIYKKLDSKFKHHFYESETGEAGKKIVQENVGKIFEESEGAVIFRGENFEPKTHTRVFINSDGIPTYEAKEVGLAKLKKDKYKYDRSITITANEQDSFFDVVEVAIGEIFPELKGKLLHLSHGMIKLPTGKMSSRTGEVITAESLIGQVKEKIREKIDDDKICEEIAIGAIKFSILRQGVGGDIIFDFDRSISFEGDSGPYLQYTAVRANSVLQKAKGASEKAQVAENRETTELERYLYRFPEIVERAGKEFAPHYIVTYLLELAAAFNNFYAKERIIDESDPASPYKIALARAVCHVLSNGLYLLGIKVPERM